MVKKQIRECLGTISFAKCEFEKKNCWHSNMAGKLKVPLRLKDTEVKMEILLVPFKQPGFLKLLVIIWGSVIFLILWFRSCGSVPLLCL